MFQSRSHLLADNPAQMYSGLAVTDIDGDGNLECIAGGWSGPNLVLKWGGDAFYDVSTPTLADRRALAMGVAAGDFDGDGREEIYIANAESAPDRIFAWRDGGWRDLLADSPLRSVSSQSVLALDRFGMGRFGFLVANEGGPFRLIELLSEDRIADNAPLLGLARIAGGRALLAGPILSKGLDIYASNEGISNMFFTAGPDGRYAERAMESGLADSLGHGRGAALIDANFDGRFDILCANAQGPHRLFLQGHSGNFADACLRDLEDGSRARGLVVADFDNDGYEEIFLHNHGGPNRLLAWRDGTWQSIDCGDAREERGFGTGAVAADWDNDGRLELMLAHGESAPQPLSLYAADAAGNHWLRVAPLTAAGAPARGAFVKLTAAGRIQIRTVDCGSGYLSQGEPLAHFGLGLAGAAESVEIRWVDGAHLTLSNPKIDAVHIVKYPSKEASH